MKNPTKAASDTLCLTRREWLAGASASAAGLATKSSIFAAVCGLSTTSVQAADPDNGPPYFFCDGNGLTSVLSPASYVGPRRYRFPASHRLAGIQTRASMDVMQRSLLHLFIRCDYDYDLFISHLNHGIEELIIPYTSRHVGMRGGWIYPSGNFHGGLDFNNRPLERYPYTDLPALSNFDVVAVADGTIVGWDGLKLLTIEHVGDNGTLYRSVYNMMRNVPVNDDPNLTAVRLGTRVRQGQVIGETWDPPQNPIHLHFGMFLEHRAQPGWQPDTLSLFDELSTQFGLNFDAVNQQRIIAQLRLNPGTLQPLTPWPEIEWFPVDPFGVYGLSRGSQTDYSLVYNGFYYPIPEGPGTYAFNNTSGDRIPLLAAGTRLNRSLSVQALSLATAAAVFS